MCRGFCSSTRYFAMSSSDKSRPNHVPYQVRNGTMMKSAATMISQMFEGRRGFASTGCALAPFGLRTSFDICHLRFVIEHLTTEDTEERPRINRGFTRINAERRCNSSNYETPIRANSCSSAANLMRRIQMIKHQVNDHAGDRNIHPHRQRPARDRAMPQEVATQRAPQSDNHER